MPKHVKTGGLLTLGALLTAAASGSAQAVIVHGDPLSASTPAAHLAAPGDDPGWANVGWGGTGTASSSAGTAVYLGNGWVLTANHTNGNGITLGTDDPTGGTRYNAISSSVDNVNTFRLENPDNTTADLRLFKVNGNPGLPALTIATSSPTVGDEAVLIGTGLTRGSALQAYPTSVIPPRTTQGYDWGSARDKAWATNVVARTGIDADYDNGNSAYTPGFEIDFDQITGEGTAANKDSGSALFIFNASENRWELAGLAVAVGNVLTDSEQTFRAAQFGNQDVDPTFTGLIDLSFYHDQIAAITAIPEPATLMLLAATAPLLCRRSRRA